MKIAAQLKQVRDALQLWAAEKGGTAEIARDPFHLLSLLQIKPGSFRAAVLFASETKRGDLEETSMVDRGYSVILSRGRGLTAKPTDSLVVGQGDGEPLFDLVEQLRELIRGLSFETGTTEVTPNYTGTEIFAVDGKAIDAYQLNFQIGTLLPVPAQPEP